MTTATDATLHPHHQAMLDASGVSPTIAAQRGYRTVTDPAELLNLGFAGYQSTLVPALLIPGTDPAGRNGRYQIRPDRPRLSNGKALKYESQAGAGLWLDAHPAIQDQLRDPAIDLWITEGVRKEDAAISAGLCCISIQGVWSWRCLSDWHAIALKGRTCWMCFDSDVTTKPDVRDALEALTAFLTSLGAKVRIVTLPAGPNGEKVGLDDFLAAGHTAADVEALAGPVTTLRDLARNPDGDEAQEITRLRERADAIEAQRDAVQRENARLRERDDLIWRALTNPEAREETTLALAWVKLTTNPDGTPKTPIPRKSCYIPVLEEMTGLGKNTIGRQFKRLDALGVISYGFKKRPNGRNQSWAGVACERDVLRRLAAASPREDAVTPVEGRARKHGGRRVPADGCHPGAPIVRKDHCGVCDQVLDTPSRHQDGDVIYIDRHQVGDGNEPVTPAATAPACAPTIDRHQVGDGSVAISAPDTAGPRLASTDAALVTPRAAPRDMPWTLHGRCDDCFTPLRRDGVCVLCSHIGGAP